MRDEQVSETELVLQILQQIEYLGLNRHVECRDGFVEDDELRFECECASDADALSLPAGELVGYR